MKKFIKMLGDSQSRITKGKVYYLDPITGTICDDDGDEFKPDLDNSTYWLEVGDPSISKPSGSIIKTLEEIEVERFIKRVGDSGCRVTKGRIYTRDPITGKVRDDNGDEFNPNLNSPTHWVTVEDPSISKPSELFLKSKESGIYLTGVCNEKGEIFSIRSSISDNRKEAFVAWRNSTDFVVKHSLSLFSFMPAEYNQLVVGDRIPNNVVFCSAYILGKKYNINLQTHKVEGKLTSSTYPVIEGGRIQDLVNEEIHRLVELGRELDPEQKTVEIKLTAYVRFEYSETVSVPANMRQGDFENIAHKAKDTINGTDYTQDNDSWEECESSVK